MTDRPISSVPLLPALALALALPTAASGQGIQAVPLPQLGVPDGVVYDAARERLLALASDTASFEADAGDWEVRTVDAPDVTGLVYDPDRQVVVAYDGQAIHEWDGVAWQQRSSSTNPPHRWFAPLAHDTARGRSVLFGGWLFTSDFGDTWEWDGIAWERRSPATSPPPRNRHGLAYDSRRSVVVLFGGFSDGFNRPNDTWEYDGTTWIQAQPLQSPPNVLDARLVFDEFRGRTVLLGPDGVWEYDGITWLRISTQAAPLGRACFDPDRGEVVVLTQTALHGWNGARWQLLQSVPRAPANDFAAHGVDPTTGRALAFGGGGESPLGSYYAIATSRSWNGRHWVTLDPARSPSARSGAQLAFDPATGDGLLFGGLLAAGGRGRRGDDSDETWAWNGANWSLLQPAHRPPGASQFGMAWDVSRGRAVLIGPYSNGTWEWDGTDWLHPATNTQPTGFGQHALVYDPLRARVVLMILESQSVPAIWEWDGVDWSRRPVQGSEPPPRTHGAVAYDPVRRAILLHGGELWGAPQLSDLWAWDGTGWSQLAAPGVLPAASRHALFHDPARGTMVLSSARGTWALGDVVQPQVRELGVGCGAPGNPPTRAFATAPRLGNAAFRLEVAAAPASSPAVFLLSVDRGRGSIGNCQIHVPPTALARPTSTNSFGRGFSALALPLDPRLRGVSLTAQAVVLDAAAPLGLAITGGLAIRLGD